MINKPKQHETRQVIQIGLSLIFIFTSFMLHSQTIQGVSQPGSFYITKDLLVERGAPPDLYAELSFNDDNGNGILEADEEAKIVIDLTNKGKGKAQILKVNIEDDKPDNNLVIESKIIPSLEPGASFTATIPLHAKFKISSADHKLKINILEHFGFDMDPVYLTLTTLEYQKPQLTLAGLKILDSGEGTYARTEDGQLEPGEQVKACIIIQNTGKNIAKETSYSVSSKDENIYLEDNYGKLGDIAIGETKEIWIKIMPNKRVTTIGNLPLYITVSEKIGMGGITDLQLPVAMNQKPPAPQIVEVKPDYGSLATKTPVFETSSTKITFAKKTSDLVEIKTVAPAKTKIPNSLGVIIGIENYENIPDAPFADDDAKLMKEYFEKKLGVGQEQIIFLTDKEATSANIKKIFNPDYGELQKAVVKGKTDIFVYYSGHGVPSKDGKKVYLFPYEGVIAGLEDFGYDLEVFYENLNRLGAKSVTVIMDACYSGSSRPSEKLTAENIDGSKAGIKHINLEKPWLNYPNFTIINSSGNETSLGYDASQTGLFTYYFCAGLQGKADENNDKKITLGELKRYVTTGVVQKSKQIIGVQTPEFHGDENRVLCEY